MYSQFGNKWANLHLGPMWGVATVAHGNASEHGNTSDTMKISPVVEKDATCHQINL